MDWLELVIQYVVRVPAPSLYQLRGPETHGPLIYVI